MENNEIHIPQLGSMLATKSFGVMQEKTDGPGRTKFVRKPTVSCMKEVVENEGLIGDEVNFNWFSY